MVRKVKRDAVIRRDGKRANDRAMSDRSVTEAAELSDDERVDLLRMSYFQSALPDLPQIPGFHVCWLTTTNPRDSIIGRERLGYQLLRAADVPGWEYSAASSGQFEGAIMVNEMVAAKLPMRLYQRYMAESHHKEPLREEEKIVAETHNRKNEAASHGSVLIESPGIVALGKDPGTPDFSVQPEPSRIAPREAEEAQKNAMDVDWEDEE